MGHNHHVQPAGMLQTKLCTYTIVWCSKLQYAIQVFSLGFDFLLAGKSPQGA